MKFVVLWGTIKFARWAFLCSGNCKFIISINVVLLIGYAAPIYCTYTSIWSTLKVNNLLLFIPMIYFFIMLSTFSTNHSWHQKYGFNWNRLSFTEQVLAKLSVKKQSKYIQCLTEFMYVFYCIRFYCAWLWTCD